MTDENDEHIFVAKLVFLWRARACVRVRACEHACACVNVLVSDCTCTCARHPQQELIAENVH